MRKLNVLFVMVASFGFATQAIAGPVVREATGANAAAIQAAVDQFRNDLGNPNNGNAAGSQAGGRREINWDGGGAAANATQVLVLIVFVSLATSCRGVLWAHAPSGRTHRWAACP